MELPNRAAVAGYGMTLVGVVTVIQYSGLVEDYVLSGTQSVIVSGGMVILGGCLAVLGLALASRPDEMHRGTERAPYWMLGAVTVETLAFVGLFLWWVV